MCRQDGSLTATAEQNERSQAVIRNKLKEYLARAETIKDFLEQQAKANVQNA